MNNFNKLRKLGIKITNTFIYDDNAILNTFNREVNSYRIFLDCACFYYEIELKDKKKFLIAFQSNYIAKIMQEYAKVSFTTASCIVYDADESREFVNYIDDEKKSDLIIEILGGIADEKVQDTKITKKELRKVFLELKDRILHPKGTFDKAGRFYLYDVELVKARSPSVRFPYSQMLAGRTAKFVKAIAEKYNVQGIKELRRLFIK